MSPGWNECSEVAEGEKVASLAYANNLMGSLMAKSRPEMGIKRRRMKEEHLMDEVQMDGIGQSQSSEEQIREIYVPPRIVTYTSEQILEQVGPALACTGTPTCTVGPT
jgi:hypothetical protein